MGISKWKLFPAVGFVLIFLHLMFIAWALLTNNFGGPRQGAPFSLWGRRFLLMLRRFREGVTTRSSNVPRGRGALAPFSVIPQCFFSHEQRVLLWSLPGVFGGRGHARPVWLLYTQSYLMISTKVACNGPGLTC